ncbi:uncharacterized protein FTOL_13656 [Fusarium torulosum]|uniref:Uncharacterized protein n=1 Tax=Fusarium torulosum TaxID=33205 RepID=A0AAE8MNY3_9HYPO|nr:uncharacterized protein FTOL_13656 [Fusarium torulosum]
MEAALGQAPPVVLLVLKCSGPFPGYSGVGVNLDGAGGRLRTGLVRDVT